MYHSHLLYCSKFMEKTFYKKRDQFYVATDCIIFGFTENRLKLLLFKRKVVPLAGKWSLIGSFVNKDENVQDAGKRVLFEITGLRNVYMDELKSYAKVDRDPGARCISIAQYALIQITGKVNKIIESNDAHWHEVGHLPKLVLDHNDMVIDALDRLEQDARVSPIGFELLPDKFTLPQLQGLYEAIYRRELDTRNFRKKILSLDILIKLDEKDKSTSKKGAFYYRFNPEKYAELVATGYSFVI